MEEKKFLEKMKVEVETFEKEFDKEFKHYFKKDDEQYYKYYKDQYISSMQREYRIEYQNKFGENEPWHYYSPTPFYARLERVQERTERSINNHFFPPSKERLEFEGLAQGAMRDVANVTRLQNTKSTNSNGWWKSDNEIEKDYWNKKG